MRKLVILVLILLFIALVFPVSCSPTQAPPSPPAPSPPPIPGPVHGCSFASPEGWVGSVTEMELDPARPVHYNIVRTVTVFEGPLVGEYHYRVNMSVVRQELPKDRTLEEYIGIVESDAKKQYPDYTRVGEYRTVIAELPAVVRTFTATSNGVPIKNTQAVFIEDTDNVGYMITYDAPEEFYDKYADCLELVMRTFEFSWKQEGNR